MVGETEEQHEHCDHVVVGTDLCFVITSLVCVSILSIFYKMCFLAQMLSICYRSFLKTTIELNLNINHGSTRVLI